jgi:hypothetical protein
VWRPAKYKRPGCPGSIAGRNDNEGQKGRGPAPKWFWIATVDTVASGAATALSALDTARTHDEFTADRSNVELSNDGKFAEGRTVVLGVVTGALAVSTVVLGAVLVDFRRGNVALGPGAMRIRF